MKVRYYGYYYRKMDHLRISRSYVKLRAVYTGLNIIYET